VGKPEGKRLLGDRCRWMDNIKMDNGNIEWRVLGWIVLTQDKDEWIALVNAVNELSDSIKN
jgi:hypothetical protein